MAKDNIEQTEIDKGTERNALEKLEAVLYALPTDKSVFTGKSPMPSDFSTDGAFVIGKLSFSYIVEIMTVDDKLSGAVTKIR